jgi:hypothetical protein
MTPQFSTEFYTDNLSLAAFLLINEHPLLRIEGQPGSHRNFVFPAPAGLDVGAFMQGAHVCARDYAANLHRLKAAIVRQPCKGVAV